MDAVLRLQDQDGRNWWQVNRPERSLSTRTGIPEQSWLNTDGEEVLTTARLVRDRPLVPGAWASPSASAAGADARAWTGSAPTWSRPWPTSCARH